MSKTTSTNCSWLPFAVLLVLTALFSCKSEPKTISDQAPGEPTLVADDPLLKLLSPSETGIDFQNNIEETFENNVTTHLNISNGGGVAIADVNNDSLQDIYLISSTGKNKLYLNLGGLKFKDITDSSGLASEHGFEISVTVVDINADGWLDFHVCRAGPAEDEKRRDKLYINNGDLTFTERSKEFGLDEFSASIGGNFFDYDNDGDLDLYLGNYPTDFSFTSKVDVRPTADGKGVEPNLIPKKEWDSDRFFRNDNGKFVDVSKEAGIWNFDYTLSITVEDFNYDGYMDVFVGNDFLQPDVLYINNGKGGFTNQIGDYLRHTSQQTMGVELADFDNDGLFDIYTVDMLGKNNYRNKTIQNTNSQSKYSTLIQYGYFEPVVRNPLHRNNGPGAPIGARFSDIGCMAGVFRTDWSWSGLMPDLDNDGFKDLCVTNGYRREITDVDFIDFVFPDIKAKGSLDKQYKDVHDFLNLIPVFKVTNYIYRNKGDWTFEDMSGKWASVPATWSNGAAYADLDNDGDLEYVVNNIDHYAFVYQNLTREKNLGNYLQFKLEGSPKNTQGIGAWVRIYHNGQQQYQMMTPCRGIFSSVEHLLHFGLGKAEKVEKLVVRWPDGKGQTLTNVPVNQRLTLRYADASETIPARPDLTAPVLFKEETATSGLDFRHEENRFNDFESFFLQPWMVTELGPLMATADVNGDKLTDVFIGNSFDKPAGLFLQTADGKFRRTSQAVWDAAKIYEKQGALFFDADNDNDPDLFVVSGGAEATASEAWSCKFYLNQGNGNFVDVSGVLPKTETVGLRACYFDFDEDGDNDIFLGGRVQPGMWPAPPRSYVLRNDRNRFTDATMEVAPDFAKVGMVTDMAWVNIDAEPLPELVVVGEWMPVTVFKIVNGNLRKMDAPALGLLNSEGIWNRLAVADLDADGDLDLVTGNLGTNTRFTASADKPMLCYANDYDKNGSVDPVMAYYEGDKIYPLVQKQVLIKQMPFIKKKFIYSKDYAKATVSEILPEKEFKEAYVLRASMLETCWWENQGGKFIRHVLPNPAQVAPVFGILAHDFNDDGKIDLLLAGNKYGMEAETSRCDAGNGDFFTGDGKGNFHWVDNWKSGFWATKEVRDLALLQGAGGKVKVLVSNNNEKVQVYGK